MPIFDACISLFIHIDEWFIFYEVCNDVWLPEVNQKIVFDYQRFNNFYEHSSANAKVFYLIVFTVGIEFNFKLSASMNEILISSWNYKVIDYVFLYSNDM